MATKLRQLSEGPARRLYYFIVGIRWVYERQPAYACWCRVLVGPRLLVSRGWPKGTERTVNGARGREPKTRKLAGMRNEEAVVPDS